MEKQYIKTNKEDGVDTLFFLYNVFISLTVYTVLMTMVKSKI